MIRLRLFAFVFCSLALISAPAEAKHHYRHSHHSVSHAKKSHFGYHHSRHRKYRAYGHRIKAEGVSFIPNPAGTWRSVASCAHRLAAYWNLGKGLDAVSTWPEVFRRASGPAIGIAAVRRDRHHIMGIVGGGPGAWRVVDFNSTRGHGNREYTISDFHGYFFVDPRSRTAGS